MGGAGVPRGPHGRPPSGSGLRTGPDGGPAPRPPGRDGPEGPCAVGASSRRRPSPWTEPTPCCGQRGGGRRQGSRRPIGPRPRPAASPEGRVRLTGVGAAVPLPAGTRAGVRPDRPPAPPPEGRGRRRPGPGAPPARSTTSVLGRHGPSRGLPAPALGRAGGSGCAHPRPPGLRGAPPPSGGEGRSRRAGRASPGPHGCPGGGRGRDGHRALGSSGASPSRGTGGPRAGP